MLDNIEPQDRNAEFGPPSIESAEDSSAQLPRRELPDVVHRWLDGDAVSQDELRAAGLDQPAHFWAQVNDETTRRRSVRTPTGFAAVVMTKLTPQVVRDE